MSFLYDVSYYGNIVGPYARISGIRERLPEHVRGYLSGLFDLQKGRYEDLFIRHHLPDYVLDALKILCPLPDQYASMDPRDAYLEYLLLPELSFYERRMAFQALGEFSKIDFFSIDCNMEMSCAIDHMNDNSSFETVCRNSKINLIMPDRHINESLSEFALTAALSESFALLPYCPVYEKYFQNCKETFVFFYDIKDAVSKAKHYLAAETERNLAIERSRQAVSELLNSF